MPVQIENISDEPIQRHIVLFEESEIELTLRFLPVVQIWVFDVIYKDRSASGFKLSNDVLHMRSQNYPFDFTVVDLSGIGLDPYRIDDFSTGRCGLYMLNAADMETVRDGPVPL